MHRTDLPTDQRYRDNKQYPWPAGQQHRRDRAREQGRGPGDVPADLCRDEKEDSRGNSPQPQATPDRHLPLRDDDQPGRDQREQRQERQRRKRLHTVFGKQQSDEDATRCPGQRQHSTPVECADQGKPSQQHEPTGER